MAQKIAIQSACLTKAKGSSESLMKKLACEMMADGQKSYGRYVGLLRDFVTQILSLNNEHKDLKTGLVPQASGSAYTESGNTKIVCAVYGPHPARRDAPFSSHAKLNVEVKFTPFAVEGRRRAPGKDTEVPTLAARVSQALLPSLRLDLLPKSAIDLFITVLQCDGPVDDISAGITASSVALAEAGVEMFGLVVAACAAYTTHKKALLPVFDPTYKESTVAQSFLSLSCMPAMSTVTNLSLNGAIDRATVKEALKHLQDNCSQIHAVAAQALLEGQT